MSTMMMARVAVRNEDQLRPLLRAAYLPLDSDRDEFITEPAKRVKGKSQRVRIPPESFKQDAHARPANKSVNNGGKFNSTDDVI
jgi:hypothetical protein